MVNSKALGKDDIRVIVQYIPDYDGYECCMVNDYSLLPLVEFLRNFGNDPKTCESVLDALDNRSKLLFSGNTTKVIKQGEMVVITTRLLHKKEDDFPCVMTRSNVLDIFARWLYLTHMKPPFIVLSRDANNLVCIAPGRAPEDDSSTHGESVTNMHHGAAIEHENAL